MKLLYVKYNRERRPEYQIKTSIYEDGTKRVVVKEGLTEKAQIHIAKTYDNWKLLADFYGNYNIEKPELVSNKLYSQYENGATLAELIQEAAQKNDKNEIDRLIKLYRDILIGFDEGNIIDFKYTPEFREIFGDIKGLENSKSLKVSNVDLNIDNIILEDDKIKIIDYEWVYDFPIPVDYILYRNLLQLYANNQDVFDEQIFSKYLLSFNNLEILGEMFYAFNRAIFKLEDINLEYTEILAKYKKKNSNINPYNIQLYYKTKDDDYAEERSIIKRIEKQGCIGYRFELNTVNNLEELRLDPIDSYGKFKLVSYRLVGQDGNDIKITNTMNIGMMKKSNSDYFMCYTDDPKIYFSISEQGKNEAAFFEVYIECNMSSEFTKEIIDEFNILVDDKNQDIYQKDKLLESKCNEIESLQTQICKFDEKISDEEQKLYKQNQEITRLSEQLQVKDNELVAILNSTSWKMTRGLRSIGRVMRENKALVLAKKTIKSVGAVGLKGTVRKIKLFLHKQKAIKDFQAETGVDLSKDSSLNHKAYNAHYEDNEDYSQQQTDVKALAMYLPQFHSFPENDEWWGTGFTEWVNTRKTNPRFAGHYQPREPHEDIGYYDLLNIETLKRQAELAKQHGIYGFCFYHYWFSGKRLMEKPVDMLLEHPEIDINFCLCWANENWTRAWDGQSKSVLIAQEYSKEDQINFIKDMKKYIDDKRYIRIDGKPVIVVYNPGQIPDIESTFETWRKYAREIGIGDILIWTCQTANNTAENLNIEDAIDAEVEFPPHNMWFDIIGERNIDLSGKEACIYNYRKLVEIIKHRKPHMGKKPIYRTSMLGWDNAARRENNWVTFYEFSLKSYYDWLNANIDEARSQFKESERFIFINAWNEWAEGTYLEPDKKYGYTYLNTTSKALMNLPFSNDLEIVTNEYECQNVNKSIPRIGIQIHLFYTETINEIISYVNNIPYDFDCLITTDTEEKSTFIQDVFNKQCNAKEVKVKITPNRGRDVLPLLLQVKELLDDYDYICHIHSKKTNTSDYGDFWRTYLYNNLLGSSKFIESIINKFESDDKVGMIFPETYPVLSKMAVWGGNEICCQQILDDLGCAVELDEVPVFPVGNMFWARVDAVRKIFERGYDLDNFPKEQGQVNATLAHAIERLWVYIARDKGYKHCKMLNYTFDSKRKVDKKKLALFVHYDKEDKLSKEDIYYVEQVSKVVDSLLFITNSKLSMEDLELIKPYSTDIVQRNNVGFDFAAWRDGLEHIGYDQLKEYDQLYLINNSCYGPIYDLNTVICDMEEEDVDFWGITYFPYSPDGSYINKSHIDEHIQSYFMVFNKNVFTSKCFEEYWKGHKDCTEFKEVIAEGETKLTSYLNKNGFSYSVYIKESELLMRYLNNYRLIYEKPYYYLLLKSPFIKKKCDDYIDIDEKNRIGSFKYKL